MMSDTYTQQSEIFSLSRLEKTLEVLLGFLGPLLLFALFVFFDALGFVVLRVIFIMAVGTLALYSYLLARRAYPYFAATNLLALVSFIGVTLYLFAAR
ncbi:MAG: hypothetical protein WEA04_01550 [Candidatus Andersenbacteria bacterium]